MKSTNQVKFKSIFKSTMIFGSTQVFQMMIMLLRSKIAAVLLGPQGVGLNAIFQTTVLTIGQFSSIGIFDSGVKEISQFHNVDKKIELDESIEVFSKISNFLSIFSLIVMIALCIPLSHLSFENSDYASSFALLSLGACFYLLSQKQITIMKATRQVKNIALSSLVSAFSTLIITASLYLLYGVKGIVPAIILAFLAQFIISYLFTKKTYNKRGISLRSSFLKSKSLLSLGLVLMISVLLINSFTLLLNALISKYGNIEDLGLFHSAFSITNGNILILISVLSSDYFPKLSSNINDDKEVTLLVNQQSELMSLITAPITILLILFSTEIVRLLLSKEFVAIVPMLKLMSIGLLFRIIWQSLSYVILSKGDKKTYFIYDALLGNGLVFISNVWFYFEYGLIGLGYSFVLSSIVVSVLLTIIVSVKYKIYFSKTFLISFFTSVILCVISYYVSVKGYHLSFSLLVLFGAILFSFYIFAKRMELEIIPFFKNMITRRK